MRLGRDAKIRDFPFCTRYICSNYPLFPARSNSHRLNFDVSCLQAVKLCFQRAISDFPYGDEFTIRWRLQLQKNRSAVSNLCSFVFEPPGQKELIVWKTESRFLFSLAAHALRACEARVRASHAALILL